MKQICYHLFTSKRNNRYAFDYKNVVPIYIDDDMFYTLLCLKEIAEEKNGFIEGKIVNQMISGYPELIEIVKEGLLFVDHIQIEKPITQQYCFSFAPVFACNLSCKYCFSNRKEELKYMDIDVLKKALLFFFNTFEFDSYRIDFVSGGEPLFDKKHFKRCVKIINDMNRKYNKKCLYWLVTNSLMLDEDILNFLDKNNFQIGISIDGNEKIHDSCRVNLKNEGTYAQVANQISAIINSESLSRRIRNIWSLSVISAKTKSIPEIIDHNFQLGIKNMQMKVVRTDNLEYKVDSASLKCLYSELLIYMEKLMRENSILKFCSIINMNDYFGKIFCKIFLHISVKRRCNAGLSRFSISPEGDIFPCDSFVGVKKFIMGNIFSGFNDNYLSFRKHDIGQCNACGKCWARLVCGGDCMHNSYQTNRDITIPDKSICDLNLFLIEEIIELIILMARDYPEFSKRVYSIVLHRFLLSEV